MPNLPARLIDVLRCPVTGSALVQEGDVLRTDAPGSDGEHLTYGLDEGIPVLLRAELLGAARTS